jgi:hypothetical protein
LGEGDLELLRCAADAEFEVAVNAALERAGSAKHATLYNGELGIVNGEV